MRIHDEIKTFVDELITQGQTLLETKTERVLGSVSRPPIVKMQPFHRWSTSARHLVEMLGPLGKPWAPLFDKTGPNLHSYAVARLGALESIRDNLEAGRLARVEELVNAETFANLLEQAEHLLAQKYDRAAAVLCRAVLEERLRLLCDARNVLPEKSKPTINDYTQSLYAADVIDKMAMKHVEAMAAVGNAAAHGDDLTAQDAKRLLRDVTDFLNYHKP
jgi:hypothetical protein